MNRVQLCFGFMSDVNYVTGFTPSHLLSLFR
jgi:uncharacterized membrane protein